MRLFYTKMEQESLIKQNIRVTWKLKASTRVTVFTWLMLRNKILTIDNLVKRGWNMPNRCCLCQREEESVTHLFTHCLYIKIVINTLMMTNENMDFRQGNYKKCILNRTNRNIAKSQVTLCFVTWRERCARIFKE